MTPTSGRPKLKNLQWTPDAFPGISRPFIKPYSVGSVIRKQNIQKRYSAGLVIRKQNIRNARRFLIRRCFPGGGHALPGALRAN